MTWFDGFEAQRCVVNGTALFVRTGGRADATALVLLHGFPQTHVLWHRAARRLAPHFRLVLPDLRGYGDSAKPEGGDYSKRAMAADIHALMRSLGHERYAVAGHDRGGRVAHRLALDQPDAVTKLALIDIAPTLDMYERTDMAFARAYYHWFHLIQPAPLPERMIAGDAAFYLHTKLGGWGAPRLQDAGASAPRGGASALGRPGGGPGLHHIEPEALAEYERCFCRPDAIHAACEDYRASAGIDLEHDRASRAAGQRIACPTLLLWGERGVVHRLFDPVALWQAQCAQPLSAQLMGGAGHFIPEEQPQATADALLPFFAAGE